MPYTITLTGAGAMPAVGWTNGASMIEGEATLILRDEMFATTDVGKDIAVAGVGPDGGKLLTTIVGIVSGTEAILGDAASTSQTQTGATWGHDCSVALQAALDAVRDAGGGTVVIDGRFLQTRPVAAALGAAAAVTIKGSGSDSAIYVACPANDAALTLDNCFALRFEDVNWLGTHNESTDALRVLGVSYCFVEVLRCGFYGLASYVPGGNIISASRSSLVLEESRFLGCSAAGVLGNSVIQNTDWANVRSIGNRWIDYGHFGDQYHSKTGFGVPVAWVGIGSPSALPQAEEIVSGGHVHFSDDVMDENVLYAIQVNSSVSRTRRVHIENLRINVTTVLNGVGIYLGAVDDVTIERVTFAGFDQGTRDAIYLTGCSNVLVNRIANPGGAKRLSATSCGKVVLRNAPDFTTFNITATAFKQGDPGVLKSQSVTNVGGGGVAPGSAVSYFITGLDCLSNAVTLSASGGGEHGAADKGKVNAWVELGSQSASGCTVRVQNNGSGNQTLNLDYAVIG